MATSTFSIRYRPIKIGFLVRPGSINDIVEASSLNTLLWGGIYNPIIPVNKDLDLARQLIKLFNVDVLFAVSNTEEIQVLLNEYEYLKSPHYFNREILYEDWYSKKQVSGYLDIINIVDFYWDKEFKNKPKKYRSNCFLVEWFEKDLLANLFVVIFGMFPEGLNLKYDYRNAFLKELKANRTLLKNKEGINGKLSQVIYPLALTRNRLIGYSGGFQEYGIYAGDSESFDDLLSFWNLRASGLDLQFLPTNSRRLDSFICQHLSSLDRIPNRNPNIEDFICIYFRNSNSAEFHSRTFKTTKRKVYCQVDKIIWNGLNIKPNSYYFDYNQALGNVDQRFGEYSVSIALLKKPVIRSNRNFDSQDIMAVIDPATEFEYPEHTLKLPFIQDLNEFYSRQIVLIDPWKLRVEKDGIGLIQKISDGVIHLYPIKNIKLIEKIFDFVGVQSGMSQAGRLAYWIIHQMREHDPLEACRVFKIRGVRSLIGNPLSSKAVKWEKALETIGSDNFYKFKKLFIEPRNQPKLTPMDVWNYLIKKQIFTSTLPKGQISSEKKLFQCKRCGLKSKIAYDNFSKKWNCGFCEYEHYLPQFIGEVFKNKNEIEIWNFKKSKLFAKDNNQEGAIPVIVTLLQIKRRFHDPNFVYSTSLQLKPSKGNPCETDLVVFNYKRENEIEVGIGECKSNGGKIDENDITNLKNIREHFESKGLKCYLIFSKTAEAFTEDEIELFKRLTEENIYPILFTNKELEPYEPYEEYHESNLPRRYVFTLEDMAINSAHIYLKNKYT
jgi:hypothetical protein